MTDTDKHIQVLSRNGSRVCPPCGLQHKIHKPNSFIVSRNRSEGTPRNTPWAPGAEPELGKASHSQGSSSPALHHNRSRGLK